MQPQRLGRLRDERSRLHDTAGRVLVRVSVECLHQAELQVNWQRIKAGQPLDRIAPLE
jgi:hypothetical protein